MWVVFRSAPLSIGSRSTNSAGFEYVPSTGYTARSCRNRQGSLSGSGPQALGCARRTGMYLGLNAAVNAITHTFGTRPYDNTATNLKWLAFLTVGEGLHNNHHAAPTSAKFALNRGDIDLAWPLIVVSQRLGWLTVRHQRVKLKQPVGV